MMNMAYTSSLTINVSSTILRLSKNALSSFSFIGPRFSACMNAAILRSFSLLYFVYPPETETIDDITQTLQYITYIRASWN